MQEKSSFVFYETFYESLIELPEDVRLRFYEYVAEFGLYGKEPDISGIELALWKNIQFAIENSQKRRKTYAENGKNGGRPCNAEKPTTTQDNPDESTETKDNQKEPSETKDNQKEPNHNLNVNVNVNDNVNVVGVEKEFQKSDTEPIPEIIPESDLQTTTTTVTVSVIKNKLAEHDLHYDDQTLSKIHDRIQNIGSLDYIRYVYTRLQDRQDYQTKSAEDIRRIFLAALLSWQDYQDGFPAWQQRTAALTAATQRTRQLKSAKSQVPKICPDCGTAITAEGVAPRCPQCGGWFDFDNSMMTWKWNARAIEIDLSATLPTRKPLL